MRPPATSAAVLAQRAATSQLRQRARIRIAVYRCRMPFDPSVTVSTAARISRTDRQVFDRHHGLPPKPNTQGDRGRAAGRRPFRAVQSHARSRGVYYLCWNPWFRCTYGQAPSAPRVRQGIGYGGTLSPIWRWRKSMPTVRRLTAPRCDLDSHNAQYATVRKRPDYVPKLTSYEKADRFE